MKMRVTKYILAFTVIVLTIYYFKTRTDKYSIISGETMGTYYTVKIASSINNKVLNDEVKVMLTRINEQMSVFDKNSEISKINNAEKDVWIPVSDDLSVILKEAHKTYQTSNGYFDPTMGKLVDLWGFGASKQKRNPTSDEIKEALKYTGFNKIKFSPDYKSIKKTDERIYINLSALAKGYGIDKIAELLKQKGYENFVVEIGGEVRAEGRKSNDVDGWNIGVTNPKTEENTYIITLKDQSVATSGDYRNLHIVDGKRYSHTISPKTGYPVEHTITSVTVFNKSCMRADALSTAIMAMGEAQGIAFANKNNLPVIIFTRDENENIKSLLSIKAKELLETQNAENQPQS